MQTSCAGRCPDSVIVAVLFALVIDDGPCLHGGHGLDKPDGCRRLVLQFEDYGIGLQVRLAGYQTGLEALVLHPRDDGTAALDGHIVVVTAVLDEVTLREVRFPAVGNLYLGQLGLQGLVGIATLVHIGGLEKLVERVET